MFIGNKKRYIEVIQCSGEDMNLVLTQGVSPATMSGGAGGIPTSSYMTLPAAAPMMPGRPLISPGMSLVSLTFQTVVNTFIQSGLQWLKILLSWFQEEQC